jgi:hypothetical protein
MIRKMAGVSRVAGAAITLAIALASPSSKPMADGRLWTTRNLDITADNSYC